MRTHSIIALRTFFFCLLAGLAVTSFGATRPSINKNNDHLLPIGDFLDPGYYALLSRKLFVTPANFARIVDYSSGAGEGSIAIYSKRGSGDVFITRTKAEESLWYKGSDEQFRFTKNPSVSISRVDVPFPKPVALAVSDAIKHMLNLRRSLAEGSPILVDGRAIEFSVDDQTQKSVRGVLTEYAKGKNGTALRQLTELLQKYCHAEPADRARLADKIEAEARKLME